MNARGIILVVIVLLLIGAGAFFFIRPEPLPTLPGQEAPATTTPEAVFEDSGQYYDISATYPDEIRLGDSASPSAKASAEAVVSAWVRETAATFKANSNLDSLTEEDIRIQGLNDGRKYTLDATYKEYVSDDTVSYLFQVYEDTLGAHPNAYYRSFTFDADTGKELRIADLFEDTSYLETLSEESRTLLIPQIAKATEVPEDELDTEYIETGTTPDANNFQIFYFTETDLVIVFPPYQVGPWVLGTQTVAIPRTELEGVIKAEYQ